MAQAAWKRHVALVCLLLILLCLAVYLLSCLSLYTQPASVTRPPHLTIDDVIRGGLNAGPGPLLFVPTSCRPQSDVVLATCPHCHTDSLAMLLRRYAFVHNLSVVVPRGQRSHLGWPRPLTEQHYRPSCRRFNMLSELAVYNVSLIKRLVNEGAVFLAVLRHPLDLLVSALRRTQAVEAAKDSSGDVVRRRSQQGVNNSVEEGVGGFLVQGQLGVGDSVEPFPRQSWNGANSSISESAAFLTHNRHGTKGSFADYVEAFLRQKQRGHNADQASSNQCNADQFPLNHDNPQSRCLSVPDYHQGLSQDKATLSRHFHQLDSQFLLVMIREHLDESLVLLKRLLCWDFKDIVYMAGQEDATVDSEVVQSLSGDAQDLHRQQNSMDYALYEYFNTTLWNTVRDHGSDFWRDLAYFRDVRQQVTWYCGQVAPYGEGYVQLAESVSSPAWRFTSGDCRLMGAPLLDWLKDRHQRLHPHQSAADVDYDDDDDDDEGGGVPLC